MLLSIVALDPISSLQRSVFMSGRGFSYFAETDGLPLSLKSMHNGRALYRLGRAEIAVDDGGYLILNQGQPYSIEIASPTCVETFVLWFPNGWAAGVAQSSNDIAKSSLRDGYEDLRSSPDFFQRYTPHNEAVSPKVRQLRAAFKAREPMSDGWLQEKVLDLLAAMLSHEGGAAREVTMRLPAVRASTRHELWRRVHRARDHLHAHLSRDVSLGEIARVACLSPFHLLRVFRAAFGQTPHQYLTGCRMSRAKFLLEKTAVPVTAICLECGFTSLGSFSTAFQKHCGISPRKWRQRFGRFRAENSNIREVYLMAGT
jgi:AraC family transcriptional regulator